MKILLGLGLAALLGAGAFVLWLYFTFCGGHAHGLC